MVVKMSEDDFEQNTDATVKCVYYYKRYITEENL